MECIQRKFRLNQVNKWLGILDLHTTDKSFDDFALLVQKSKVLTRVGHILSLVNNIANYGNPKPISSTTFLTSFVISGYPNDTLSQHEGAIRGTTQERMNDTILQSSKALVSTFNSLYSFGDVVRFHKMLVLYKDTFSTWKTMDVKTLVHALATSYYDLDDIINTVYAEGHAEGHDEGHDEGHAEGHNKMEYIELCRAQQEDIINKIIFLNGQEYFNRYRREEISTDETLSKHIQDILYKAYWDILEKELNTQPPVCTQLVKILTEIQELFCQFVPNRPDIQEEIRDKIDPDLIRNMVEHQAFDDDNLYSLVMYIISLIKKFQPPVMDKKVGEWEIGMGEALKKQPLMYSQFLCTFLHSVFNMIQSIQAYIVVAQTELSR